MNDRRRFHDRHEAGQLLARDLTAYKGREDVIVLALPRGGVPVGYEVARELHAPLDGFVVRKLGVPWQPELAMGAIAGDGVDVLNGEDVICRRTPLGFSAVGLWYDDFSQTTDEEVRHLLGQAAIAQSPVH